MCKWEFLFEIALIVRLMDLIILFGCRLRLEKAARDVRICGKTLVTEGVHNSVKIYLSTREKWH